MEMRYGDGVRLERYKIILFQCSPATTIDFPFLIEVGENEITIDEQSDRQVNDKSVCEPYFEPRGNKFVIEVVIRADKSAPFLLFTFVSEKFSTLSTED